MGIEDRVDPKNFSEDEPVGIGVRRTGVPPEQVGDKDGIFVSERLFKRLLHLGRAYALHFPDLIDANEDSYLNARQCEGTLTELEFLAGMTSDCALSPILSAITERVREDARDHSSVLWISPP